MSVPPQLATAGSIRLVPLPVGALRALLEGNLESASTIAGLSLTPYFVEHGWLWDIRVPQIERDRSVADWIARAAVDGDVVVGHVGFHGPPDGRGMVEVAYSVDPAHRRRGYGRAMLAAALAWAHAERIPIVRATISPENGASLATLARFPFALGGEQWDEEDGRELVYELLLDRWSMARTGWSTRASPGRWRRCRWERRSSISSLRSSSDRTEKRCTKPGPLVRRRRSQRADLGPSMVPMPWGGFEPSTFPSVMT